MFVNMECVFEGCIRFTGRGSGGTRTQTRCSFFLQTGRSRSSVSPHVQTPSRSPSRPRSSAAFLPHLPLLPVLSVLPPRPSTFDALRWAFGVVSPPYRLSVNFQPKTWPSRLNVESCALSVECSLPPSPPPPFSFLLSHLVCTPSVGRMAVLLGRPSHRRITIRRHRHQQNGHAPAGLSTHGECGILNQILKKGREVFRDTTVGGGIHDGGTHHGMRRVRRGNAAAG